MLKCGDVRDRVCRCSDVVDDGGSGAEEFGGVISVFGSAAGKAQVGGTAVDVYWWSSISCRRNGDGSGGRELRSWWVTTIRVSAEGLVCATREKGPFVSGDVYCSREIGGGGIGGL